MLWINGQNLRSGRERRAHQGVFCRKRRFQYCLHDL